MDTKRTILGMAAIMILVLGWTFFVQMEYKNHPEWQKPGDVAATQNSISPTTAESDTTQPLAPGGLHVLGANASPILANATTQISAATQAIVSGPTMSAMPSITAPSTAPVTSTIGSENASDPTYAMGLQINSIGGGIDSVTLNRFYETVDKEKLFAFQHPYDLSIDQSRPLSIASITVDGNAPLPLVDQAWTFSSPSDKAKGEMTLVIAGADGKPMLRLVRDYTVLPASDDSGGPQGYEVEVDTRVENLSSARHTVSVQFNGPTVPKPETERQASEVVAGFNNQGTIVNLEHRSITEFKGDVQTVSDYQSLPLMWFGASSNYFNAICRPTTMRDTDKPWIGAVTASALNPQDPASDRLVAIQYSSTQLDLAPADAAGLSGPSSVLLPMRVFFGPKARGLLNSAYYKNFPMSYDDTLVMVSGFCGICTFPALISVLYYMLTAFHFVLRDWGLAIIALVCLVRVCLHPITKRSQVSMMKMQKMGPEMEKLKKKFGDDKDGFARAQMDLYKQIGFTPVLGCLPMFLQMPIFIGLWRALQTTFELRQAPFLRWGSSPLLHWTWIKDLSQPDALISFGSGFQIPILGWHVYALNILPLAMAAVTFINQKYFSPQPVATTPEQAQQQKMMQYMTPMFGIMFYAFPSGLNLYYFTSTTLGILESKRIRAHIKAREAAENDGRVIVDAGKSGKKKSDSLKDITDGLNKVSAKKPRGGLSGWLEDLQAKAEQIRRDAQRNKPS